MRCLLLCVIFAAGAFALGDEAGSASSEMPEAMLAFPTPVAPASAPLDLSYPHVDKRLFGIIPNYKADQYQARYTPLSTAGKFAIARSDSFDWPNYFLLAGYALQSQMAAGGFGHGGFAGFGSFYSRSIGDQIMGAYVTEAILPTLFHEDPRFFRLGKGPIWHRASNACLRIVVARKDDGTNGFYFSEVIGNMGVTAIGTLYYADNRSASEALERYGMALGNDMISNLLTEFWPDIKRKLPLLHHKA